MRRLVVILALAVPWVAAADIWDEAYNRGLNAIKHNEWAVAAGELQSAVEAQPNEFISERTRNGLNEYLPHYWLGVAKYRLGDVDGALAEWRISEKQGVARKNPVYAPQLRDWIETANKREYKQKASSALEQASSAQQAALAAGATGSRSYGAAEKGLAQAREAYAQRDANSDSYRRAYELAYEANTLFLAATNEAKTQTQARVPAPVMVQPIQPMPQRVQAAHPRPKPPIQTIVPPAHPVTMTTSAPSPTFADEQLKGSANIAFNTPDQIGLEEHRLIKLLLDVQRPGKQLEIELHEAGHTTTASIKISETVEARLTGAAFDIRAITPELQAISAEMPTEWQWEVTPKQEGKQRLFLAVNAILGNGADERKRSIRTFDRTIEVEVPPHNNAGWIATVVVLAVLVVALLSLLALRHRTPPAAVTVPVIDKTVPVLTPARSSGSSGFREGEVIDDRYRIVRLLGQGGMGTVYGAEDREFGGEMVALKTILTTGKETDQLLARFKKEIQLARRVAHPNVCRIFDVGYHVAGPAEKAIFVSMEYIRGVSLKTAIQQKGRFNEKETLAIIRDIAAALAATHGAGLIHRDVKSGNVMLAETSNRAVLMDFGLACLIDPGEGEVSLTQTGAIIGTPAYMSPEQIEGAPLTAASDIYAFGVVIYEMVTGRLPYEGDTPVSILAKRVQERPTSPVHFVPNLRREWEQAILTCLEHDPAKRFRSAMDVYCALDRPSDAPTLVV